LDKKTKDHNNKSGNDRKTCAFEKELDIMFEGNPSIKPAASSSSCIFPVQEKRKELDGNSFYHCEGSVVLVVASLCLPAAEL
jgi:hypothetical protein